MGEVDRARVAIAARRTLFKHAPFGVSWEIIRFDRAFDCVFFTFGRSTPGRGLRKEVAP